MEPFIAEIIMFGGNFAPRGWAKCDGQLLAINSYQALFSLLGTTYGGDGRTTFGLPDLRGRVPMHAGNGPGLTPRPLGQKSGNETTTLTINNLPSHNHGIAVSSANGDKATPVTGDSIAKVVEISGRSVEEKNSFITATPNVVLNGGTIQNAGGGQAVNNLQPYQTVNFIIALTGIFPSRN